MSKVNIIKETMSEAYEDSGVKPYVKYLWWAYVITSIMVIAERVI